MLRRRSPPGTKVITQAILIVVVAQQRAAEKKAGKPVPRPSGQTKTGIVVLVSLIPSRPTSRYHLDTLPRQKTQHTVYSGYLMFTCRFIWGRGKCLPSSAAQHHCPIVRRIHICMEIFVPVSALWNSCYIAERNETLKRHPDI